MSERSPYALVRACRREQTEFTPVWLLRQAGRYLPAYRSVRERFSFLELCTNSDVAADVTVSTAEYLGVDAAIIFADILLPLGALDLGLSFAKGDGPRIERPLRTAADVDAMPVVDVRETLGFVAKTVELAHRALASRMPVIGFAGAPFTVASYAIEGGASRNYVATKSLMHTQPELWSRIMDRIVSLTVDYLNMQVDAGADVVQLFDSWIGALSPRDYVAFVQPHTRRLIAGLRAGTPVIHFGTMTASLLTHMRDAGGDIIGLDWRVNLDEAWRELGDGVGVQGNLDPVMLFADRTQIRNGVADVLRRAARRPGHIFNLGHGILPETPVDNVRALVDAVHELGHR